MNDEQQAADAIRVAAMNVGGLTTWQLPPPISDDKWRTARLTPRCIVESYLYADVGLIVAPGSTGKTTFNLYEMVHVALGRPLLGLKIYTPGSCVLVTGEDRREYLVGRLREISDALNLTDIERAKVKRLVRIDDRTKDVRRLACIANDVVQATGFADEIVKASRDIGPVLVQFDPLISFGVGESRVNDAMQALVEAGRILVAGLDCCVRFTHHTSQNAARDKITDQYAARSGTALPDGCRMVSVLVSADDAELFKATGEHLKGKQSAFALHRPKLSYAPPERAPLHVRRDGYGYELLRAVAAPSSAERAKVLGEQSTRFLESESREHRHHTRNTLESVKPGGMARDDVRAGLAWLTASGLLSDVSVIDPATGKAPKAGSRTYLVPRSVREA